MVNQLCLQMKTLLYFLQNLFPNLNHMAAQRIALKTLSSLQENSGVSVLREQL